MTIVFSSS